MQFTAIVTALYSVASLAATVPTQDASSHSDLVSLVTITSNGYPSVTPAPTKCDDAWCTDGTSWCVYFAGITGWDPSKGVVPGETAVPLGSCSHSASSLGTHTVTTRTTAWVTSTVWKTV